MSDPNANRPGYKETKVGWVPEEWRVKRIGDAGETRAGRQRSPHATGTNRKYLRVANVFEGRINYDDILEMPFTDKEFEIFKLLPGDILLNEGQSLELVGRSAVFNGNKRKEYCYQNTLLRFRPSEIEAVSYFQHLFTSYLYGGKFARVASRTTSIAHLGADRFEKLYVPIPTLPEQKKIAEILSTWDEAIEKTGELIEAKKRQKRALMQQLLTGKKRLPGFDGSKKVKSTRVGEIPADWSWEHLGNLFQKHVERSKEALPLGAVTIDRGMVPRSSIDRKVDSNLAAEDNLVVRKGDIAYNTMRMWQGAAGVAAKDCLVSPAYVVCRPKKSRASSDYFLHWFKSSVGRHLLTSFSYGVTSDRLRLYFQDFSLVPAPVPSLKEQNGIVSILKAADAEIEQLQKKMTAFQQQKKALMQKLLTGQIRVKT